MKDVRNPFRLQTAESIDSDADFLRLFGFGVLDLLPAEALTGRPLFIRSAPGGGKTSLLKLFTPSVLQHLMRVKGNETVKELFGKLKGLGAVSDHHVKVLSVMLPCARMLPALADVELKPVRAKRLLLALIDARIILGALRAILISRGLRFPDDLSRLGLVAPPDGHVPGLSFPCDGIAVQQWAQAVEQGVADLIDTLMRPEAAGPPGHDAMLSLQLLDANCIQLDGIPFEIRWLVSFDDMHKLAPDQRAALVEVVVDQRARTTVWLAERFEALSTEELLASGALSGRDYEVINLESELRKKGRFEPAVKLIAERRSRMAAESAGTNAPDAFAPTIEVDLDAPSWNERSQAALDEVRMRVEALAAREPQYIEWVKSPASGEGTLRQQLIWWRTLEILIARKQGKRQLSLPLGPLSTQELDDRNDSDVRAAAELFLSKEFGFPYYFGLNKLASLGFFNVEQFLRLAGDLFEESLAASIMRRSPQLGPERQQRILQEAYDTRVKDLPRRAKNGRVVLHFLDAVGRFCHDVTHQPNAPYSPGVTGIAIHMHERDQLLDDNYLKKNPGAAMFKSVLGTAIANNLLLVEPDYKVKGTRCMVLYLNRLLCPKYELPLQYGGFREKPLREFIDWAATGYRSPKAEMLL
ncbi:hypothetical protein [Synechococcus sp. CCAP 1479/9]|uniref:ORC-CDC6 family AAA ATPase n=1 Tax=Synechococcus sp. CCAP 1479/9 TaxID=1221593 RepID=UPI001C24EB16|nr:hypothetical protein [Synechococcus sp. CCAP 1479/9]